MKMWVLVLAIWAIGFKIQANDGIERGGEMPFPIGKTIELPMDDVSNDFWEVPKIDRYIKIDYLAEPTLSGDLSVKLLNYRNQIIAEGIGKVHNDKILRAMLQYKRINRFVSVMLGSYCDDPKPQDGGKKFTRENCLKPRYMVTFEQVGGVKKAKMKAYNMQMRSRRHDDLE